MELKKKTLAELSETMFESMGHIGYAKRTINTYRLVYKQLAAFAAEKDCLYLTPKLAGEFIAEFAAKHPEDSKNGIKRNREVHRLLAMLSDCAVHGAILHRSLSAPKFLEFYMEELDDFKVFAKSKGLSEASIGRICFVLGHLSSFLYQRKITSFSSMGKDDLSAFIKTQGGFARKTMATSMYALRVLILFMNETGSNTELTQEDVPSIKYVSRRSLPKIWSDEECRKILGVVDTGTARGKRDYAILMLVINTGMRQCDILNLKFGDIDWAEHTIHFVQQKTGLPNTLTFDDATGWAVIDYIRNGRPENDGSGNIFLRHAAPCLPMKSFYTTLSRYLRLADIHVQPERMHGMHSLRHSLANRMLRENVPIGTIADILGHADLKSAEDYIQVDIGHLRECALEVDL